MYNKHCIMPPFPLFFLLLACRLLTYNGSVLSPDFTMSFFTPWRGRNTPGLGLGLDIASFPHLDKGPPQLPTAVE